MLDRIDIQKYVQPVDFIKLSDYSKGSSSSELRQKVEFARNIQRERYKTIENINSNAEMTPALIKEFCILDDESKKLLQMAFNRFKYSARTFHKFLKVARTFADMDGAVNISILTYGDSLYPNEVKDIKKAPVILYYRGNIIGDSMGVAIVGSRRCTEYGKKLTVEVSEFLNQNQTTIISGMAKEWNNSNSSFCKRTK